MDEIDEKILNELIDNSRISISKISQKTGIPDSTISNRLKKLEENNVIEQYTTLVNPEAIGVRVTAHIIIQTETEKHVNVEEELPKLEKVSEVFSISGEYDILIKVWAHTLEELNDIISQVRTIDGIEELRELIVMERLKEEPLKVDITDKE
ncbi:MAG: Lrp/AsnC family transcriptional regulator [Methanosphaera sp.]|nr:Lrp/AsnC family transcriptional regulator [Methanosphaera sp.]